jgi:hypothetical protein
LPEGDNLRMAEQTLAQVPSQTSHLSGVVHGEVVERLNFAAAADVHPFFTVDRDLPAPVLHLEGHNPSRRDGDQVDLVPARGSAADNARHAVRAEDVTKTSAIMAPEDTMHGKLTLRAGHLWQFGHRRRLAQHQPLVESVVQRVRGGSTLRTTQQTLGCVAAIMS